MRWSVPAPLSVRAATARRRTVSRIGLTAVAAAVAIAGAFAIPAAAQPPPNANANANAAAHTARLLALAEEYRGAPAADRGRAAEALARAAAERAASLLDLMETDPAEVLRLAVPPGLRASLPAAVQADVEEPIDVEGIVEVLVEDYEASHRVLHFLQTSSRRYSLHFAGTPPDLLSDTRIRARGLHLHGALALESRTVTLALDGSGGTMTLAASSPASLGEQRVLVMLVNFLDKTSQPYTPAQAWNVVFGTTSPFYLEGSSQQTWLTGDVYGWFTIPMESTVCDQMQIATLARQAAANAGANLSAYGRHLFAFPNNACTWWGLGSVGGNPSRAWVNGSLALRVVGHELGHNLGLYHSQSLDCGSTPIGPSCTASTYGDTTDIMGATSTHFSAFQKERIGWLNFGISPPITTVQTSGTYSLEPYGAPGFGTKALKILKASDTDTWYYVEYRQRVGYDSGLAAGLTGGVVVHTGSGSSGNSSYLLDMTSTSSFNDAALPVGQTFADAHLGLSMTVVSADAGGASVAVTLGSPAPAPCTPGPPTVTLSPSATQYLSPGSGASYSLSVKNMDSSTCSAVTFTLASLVPSGWSGALGAGSVTLAPGASQTTSFAVTAPASAAPGVYDFTARASKVADPASAGSATVSGMVTAPPPPTTTTGPAVTLTSAIGSGNQRTVVLTATVQVDGTPVKNVNVAFAIRKADGSDASGSAKTNPNGVASYTLRLKPKDPAGTYEATASATVNGISGEATVAFDVP